jgi:hypothetical protein
MKRQPQSTDMRIPVAFGAGLAATLLLVSLRQGAAAALLLAALSPLPLMIATLGFGQSTGLAAVGLAVASFIALMTSSAPQALTTDVLLAAGLNGLIFAVCEALPAWWLARLLSLGPGQPVFPWSGAHANPDKPVGYYRLGLVVLQAALIAFLIVAVTTSLAALGQPNYGSFIDKVAKDIAPTLAQALGPHELPNGIDLMGVARLIAKAMPPVAACTVFLVFLLNLWLAGRVVQISNRLPRPWPDIAREMEVPRVLAMVLLVAVAACFLKGLAGLIATIAAAVLGVVFALQGLAVVHDLSRGSRFRGAILFILYLTLALLMPWPLLIFTFVGLLEAAFSFRDHKAAAAAQP